MSLADQNPDPFSARKPIPGIKHIIVVASGKGGVGKSTVAVNLAVAMAKRHKVGLLDADIYGPSIPRMLGTIGQRPIADENGRIQPLVQYGIKTMSIGYLTEDTSSVVWRGPMLFKALNQFINDVDWGDLDYLIIDTPPGTGDVHLTLAQKIPVSGVVLVSTPQNIALVDVKKAVDMFERVQVPILGLIENMAYLVVPGTGERLNLFPKGELDSYLEQKNILKIGTVAFNSKIALSCEMGIPLLKQTQRQKDAQLAGDDSPQFDEEVYEFADICEHIDDLVTDDLAAGSTASQIPAPQASCGDHCGCSKP